jgi:hypothetical protein
MSALFLFVLALPLASAAATPPQNKYTCPARQSCPVYFPDGRGSMLINCQSSDDPCDIYDHGPKGSMEPFPPGPVKPQAVVACVARGKTHSKAIPAGSGFGWDVVIPERIGLEPKYERQGCGQRFKDYIKAQKSGCETLTSWECWAVDGGIHVSFDTNIFCGTGQIQKAIWDATSPQLENKCFNLGHDVEDKDVTEMILGILGGVVPGHIGGGRPAGA